MTEEKRGSVNSSLGTESYSYCYTLGFCIQNYWYLALFIYVTEGKGVGVGGHLKTSAVLIDSCIGKLKTTQLITTVPLEYQSGISK